MAVIQLPPCHQKAAEHAPHLSVHLCTFPQSPHVYRRTGFNAQVRSGELVGKRCSENYASVQELRFSRVGGGGQVHGMVAANQGALRDHVAAVQRALSPPPDCLVRAASADGVTSALVPLLPSPSCMLRLICSLMDDGTGMHIQMPLTWVDHVHRVGSSASA